MIEITAEIRAFIDKAAAGAELAEDEYIDLSDGLIHCKKCGGQRQTVVPCFGKSGYFMPRCICQCQQEAEEQRKAAEERQRRMERIKRRKAQGLQDRYLYDYTFANDNGKNPLMDKARAYVENWKGAYKSNIGLLLFGDVGTGKSFFAGCIANALLDQDVPVLMTNFPTILNRLTGMFSEDRSEFIASFDEYDLLIIDDLGVERSTEYAMEQMFFVIDSRYRSRRPMIITTNLKLSELKNPPDLAHARIYDSRVEWCACFVSWCYNQAGKSEPRFAGCEWQGVPWFQSHGQWGARGYNNLAPGDAIFFDWDLDGTADHVGIVIGTDGSRVYTVEGNSGDACKIKSYDLNYQSIKGYGLMNW